MATTLSHYIKDHEELTGWRFDPSDEVLVSYFLLNKINGKEFSDFQKIFVIDYDLYGDEEPFDIWKKFGGEENQDLFFITTLKNLKKKNDEKGLRYDRKVGCNGGKWHQEDVGKEVKVSVTMSGSERIKAIRKRFNYRNPRSDQHGLWIMHEYSLEMNDQYVMCRLRKNVRCSNGSQEALVDALMIFHRHSSRSAHFGNKIMSSGHAPISSK